MDHATLQNPYETLGVASTASIEDIKAAYRRAARLCHPDTNPNDPEAAARFRDIVAAHDILSHPAKRSAYDLKTRLRRDRQQKAARRHAHQTSKADANSRASSTSTSHADDKKRSTFEDVFDAVFGNLRSNADAARRAAAQQAFSDAQKTASAKQNSAQYESGAAEQGERQNGSHKDRKAKSHAAADRANTARRRGKAASSASSRSVLKLSFAEAALGCQKPIGLPGGRVLSVHIPAGIEDGEDIPSPLSSIGILVRVDTHELFRREGQDLHMDLPISLDEALLGGRVTLPWLKGKILVKVPQGAQPGQVLRLKGKGIAKRNGASGPAVGDLYVHLKVVFPQHVDREFEAAIDDWAMRTPQNVRGPKFS